MPAVWLPISGGDSSTPIGSVAPNYDTWIEMTREFTMYAPLCCHHRQPRDIDSVDGVRLFGIVNRVAMHAHDVN